MSARDVELPAGWLTADTEAAARRIAKWQETDRQWTLPTRIALARALVPEYAVVPREPTTDMLQDGQQAARKARRPSVSGMTIDSQLRAECAVEAAIYRAMLAAGEATP